MPWTVHSAEAGVEGVCCGAGRPARAGWDRACSIAVRLAELMPSAA
nr:MAG TPA: hypothetical protein [Caudoviricetes sp.]